MTFEDIIHHLVEDLGPMDVPEEPELVVTIHPMVGDDMRFTVSCGRDEFQAYLGNVMRSVEFVEFLDINGVAHVIRTDQIRHIEIEEESNGDSPAASGGDPEAQGGTPANGGDPAGEGRTEERPSA